MTFELPNHWVWDFWTADDGHLYHLYYLHAPKSLGNPDLRHRNAIVGHATSPDLRRWKDHGPVLCPGQPDDFDGSATWTGSVVRGDDNIWRMFYTGCRLLHPQEHTNVETIGVATSTDLHTWTKDPAVVLAADTTWYETLDDGTWHEEAWRDPWVFKAADGSWHMLITARSRSGSEARDRGVIGHATSPDLNSWTVQSPLSGNSTGFAHLEVPQIVDVDGQQWLIFSCDEAHLAGERYGSAGGIWYVRANSPEGPYETSSSQLLTDDGLYAGRILKGRDGQSVLLGFLSGKGDEFSGRISDPIPVSVKDGSLQLSSPSDSEVIQS